MAAVVVACSGLFCAAFGGAYVLGSNSSAPAAPPQSTWRGTAVSTFLETTPTVVDPIAAAAALPALRLVTTRSVVTSNLQRIPVIPVSRTTTHSTTTKSPKTKTKTKATATTTTEPPLITVTN